MGKVLFNRRKTYHLVPEKGDWKIVEEITQYIPLKEGKNKADLLKEIITLARKNKPSRILIYKSGGDLQEDRNYGGGNLPPADPVAEIVSKLKKLTEELYYPSESDYLIEISTISAKENLKDELYKISGKPADSLTEEILFEDFFDRFNPQDWMDDEQKKNGRRFLKLKKYLEMVLDDPLIFRIGEIEIDIFITGKTADNNFIILKTTSIET
ncbi:MAG: nuclease A inhibitor family protein [Ferruginibacter sp.]